MQLLLKAAQTHPLTTLLQNPMQFRPGATLISRQVLQRVFTILMSISDIMPTVAQTVVCATTGGSILNGRDSM